MKKKNLQFRISSALKDIIGNDLISDDFIAVFELVKNSYDAHSTDVEIVFENINSNDAKIIIKDNGKGMNYNDLVNKWLFVAYSAKKEGTEEDNYDYRKKIKVKRPYAGAKGIGRFSCDRLGAELYLETIKDEPKAKIETLLTEWNKFEDDLQEEFINISVLHETILKSNYSQKKGTVLEISSLKSEWNRDKILKLKDALAKLINPNIQSTGDVFSIELVVPDEKKKDADETEYHKIVNGKIKNLIFETLDIKTTKIVSKVLSESLNQIETSLYEGGKLVYQITENNPFKNLHNVEAEIYYMNRSAKATFSRRMGIQPVQYGHIFVYKNGLRIYPYGERGADPLKMDNRKAQGRTRYIGTREALGFISINNPNDELRETSSRGDGLIKTEAYLDLYDWFYFTLRRVEKYIIDIVDWGNDLSREDYIKLDDKSKQIAIKTLIANLTKSKELVSFSVAPEIFEIIDKKQGKSTKNTLSQIRKDLKSEDYNKNDIFESLKKVEKNLDELKKTTEEAENEASDKLIKNEELEINLESEKKKGLFQGSLIGTDKERIMGLQHQIYHSSSRISRNLKLMMSNIGIDKIDKKTKKYIRIIALESSKINSIAKFVTKANFNLKASEINEDIIVFIKDYVKEIYLIGDSIIDIDIKVDFVDRFNSEYIKSFRPLEITTILDNLISNSEKAKANKIIISFVKNKNKLEIQFKDNGVGIQFNNLKKVCDLGYTTTKGSGIGLFQVCDLVKESLGGEVLISSVEEKETVIRIII